MKIEDSFNKYFYAQVKRVLTQMDRDPDSPTFGCFDRNHWHYKIRDFPSSILQQGAIVVETLRQNPNEILTESTAREWVIAALNALSVQAEPKGAVSEYFPFEDSYPASAFGLYAASRIILDWKRYGNNNNDRVRWSGLQKLARRLARREELQAANQYAAGVSALAMASKVPEFELSPSVVTTHADRLFELQHPEGWFHEYGGPDFGYLTVTIDALVDYHDATQDPRALTAADNAVAFLASLIGCDGELPWTLNSRNTDYVVPYGLVRTAKRNPLAAWLVHTLFSHLGDTSHAIWSTDDRYHLHYIYSSIVRSVPYLKEMTIPEGPVQTKQVWFPGCGYWVWRLSGPPVTVYVGAYKGGVLRVHRGDDQPSRYENGWRLNLGSELWTTNSWQPENEVDALDGSVTVTGGFVRYKPVVPTPLKHAVLRVLAKLLGHKLTAVLKKIMIFRRSTKHSPTFTRTIHLDPNERALFINDDFVISDGAKLVKSPRQNLRHVASADSFSVEENIGLSDFLESKGAHTGAHISHRYSI